MFGAGTVALIQPNHVEAGVPGFVTNASHVVRFMAPFEAMNQNQSGSLGTVGLPTAGALDLRLRHMVKEMLTGPISRKQRLDMGIGEEWRRRKRFGKRAHIFGKWCSVALFFSLPNPTRKCSFSSDQEMLLQLVRASSLC